MNIKLRAAANLLTFLSIAAISIGLVYLGVHLFGREITLYGIMSGLGAYALYCFYRIFLVMEEMKELRKSNK